MHRTLSKRDFNSKFISKLVFQEFHQTGEGLKAEERTKKPVEALALRCSGDVGSVTQMVRCIMRKETVKEVSVHRRLGRHPANLQNMPGTQAMNLWPNRTRISSSLQETRILKLTPVHLIWFLCGLEFEVEKPDSKNRSRATTPTVGHHVLS